MIRETYRAPGYNVLLVTGTYVRATNNAQARQGEAFRVFETATCDRGTLKGQAGMGYRLREYLTDGAEFSEEFRNQLRASRTTERLT